MSCKRVNKAVDTWKTQGSSYSKRLKSELLPTDIDELKQTVGEATDCSRTIFVAVNESVTFSFAVSLCISQNGAGRAIPTTQSLRAILKLLHDMHSCACQSGDANDQEIASALLDKIAELTRSGNPCVQILE